MEIIIGSNLQLNEWLTRGDAVKISNEYLKTLKTLVKWNELELIAYAYKRGRLDERGNNGGN